MCIYRKLTRMALANSINYQNKHNKRSKSANDFIRFRRAELSRIRTGSAQIEMPDDALSRYESVLTTLG